MARYKLRVQANGGLRIRKGPSTSFPQVGSLPDGSIIEADKVENNWYHLADNRGWSSGDYLKLIEETSGTTTPTQTPPTPTTNVDASATNTSTTRSLGIDAKVLEMLFTQTKRYDNKIDGSTRLFGCPFQFTDMTDFRVNTQLNLGRKYLENIVAESPIVYFVPGKPNYLPDLSESERLSLQSFFNGKASSSSDGDTKTAIEEIVGNREDIRYFDFITDYVEYMKYVNLLCRMAAIYLGIENEYVPGTTTPFKYYDWTDYKYKNDYISKTESKKSIFNMKETVEDIEEVLFGRYKYIQFYVEPNTSFSESASNNTTSSKLEGLFDTAEGLMKELAFLTNAAALKNIDEARNSFAKGMDEISQEMIKNSNEGFFSRFLGASSTVLEGANILFPELWGDSSYNKSYSITMNFVSPYGDKKSIFMNVIAPMLHVLALACPRQATANSYASPFLVKAFAKGWFSCELGIIDSIQIDKAASGDAWSVDGLPLDVRVNIGIRDLYSNLMISKTNRPSQFFQNQGLIDFLAVTCGVDITKPNFVLRWESMFAALFGKMVDLPRDIYKDLMQDLRNQVEKLYKL